MSEQNQTFELSHDALSKANIGLWAIEVVEGEEPRMYADATMCLLLGIEAGLSPERIYHAWYDRIDPNHYDAVKNAVDKMAAGSHAEVQYPWKHPTRGEIFVRCGGLRNMAFTRGLRFEGCHQDVTELIHIQKQATATELENKFLDKMMKGLPAPLFIKSAEDLRYRLCNTAFADIHRKPLAYFTGLSDLDMYPRDFAELLQSHDRETLETPGIHYFPCQECNLKGKSRLFDKWETCIDGGDGHKYIIGSLWDVTAFKRAERAKSEFFANVSHDIRTPLNAIIDYSQMLSAGVDSVIERQEYLDSISFSAEALLDLINDVLDLSKLEAEKVVISPERCDFAGLVRKVLLSVKPHATSRSVELKTETNGLPEIELDVRHVRQILFNLIGNAVKFTECGEVSVEASFEKTDDEVGCLRFSVRDTGIGMSEPDRQRIFMPFVQAATNRQRRGTGLGLTICKQLIERMGGTIGVDSELGKGSVFSVLLPALRYHAVPQGVASSGEQGVAPIHMSIGDLRLLLVDDIKMNLSVLKSMLKRLGVVQVMTAADGEEAMELIRKAPAFFDAVLTDMWMPRCDGTELLKRIRAFEPTVRLPVYAVTADVECKGGNGTAFSGILLKPLTLEGLTEFIRGMVG